MTTSSTSLGFAQADHGLPATVEEVQRFTDLDGRPRELVRTYTRDEYEALQASRAALMPSTPEEAAEDAERQRRSEALLRKMVNSTEEECRHLYGAFMNEMRARNRIQQTRRTRAVRPVIARACDREHRPAETRRASSSSTTSSADPGDDPSSAAYRVTLRREARSVHSYIAESLEIRGGLVTARARRRSAWTSGVEWGPLKLYCWPAREVLTAEEVSR